MLSRSWVLVLWGVLAPSQAARVSKRAQTDSLSSVRGVLAPSQAARVVKRAQTDSLSFANASVEALVQVSNPDMSSPNVVLNLDIDPQELLVNVISGIGDFDFSRDIGPQIASLAAATFLGGLGMVNPVLGAVFSVFAGMLGVEGADPNSVLVKNILAAVDKMITKSLADFTIELTKADILGTLGGIRKADRKHEWLFVCNNFADKVPSVFTAACWTRPEGNACKTWQTTGGGATALILEIEYTQLMIATHLELLLLAQNATSKADVDDYEDARYDLAWIIKRASHRVSLHAKYWKSYRMEASHFRLGSFQRGGPGYIILQGKDLLMHSGDQDYKESTNDEYTGKHCWKSPRSHRRRTEYTPDSRISFQKWGRRRDSQNNIAFWLSYCRDHWMAQVRSECDKLVLQAKAIEKVAGSMPLRRDVYDD